jgi:predicted transcriptional regulator
MAKGEPMLRDLRHEDTYAVVEHDMLMPELAKVFREQPDIAALVYEKKKDKFLGVMYLYDYLKHYGSPPKGVSSIHKATVAECADTNIISINWDENVSQCWAKINKHKPKGVLLHDKEKEFVGYLSNEDMWKSLEEMGSLEDG